MPPPPRKGDTLASYAMGVLKTKGNDSSSRDFFRLKGSRKSPDVENPRAVYADWETLRDQAQWDAVVAGKKPVGNRSPVASEVGTLRRRHHV